MKLTTKQKEYLNSLKSNDIVSNYAILQKFANMGVLELHEDTGKKIKNLYSNLKFTCFYIKDAQTFEINGIYFRAKYFSGCFCPYLIKVK
jgi:hypothetical protein